MTQLLTKAFDQAAKLPEVVQDEIARQLLDDILGELEWDKAFASSQDLLGKLADQALEEYKAGRTKQMGFDEL